MVTEGERIQINKYLESQSKSFIEFMGIRSLQDFKVEITETDYSKSVENAIAIPASHSYDYSTGIHTIKVFKDICNSKLKSDYLLFHEFTHMYDVINYSDGTKLQYALIKGFTEYHAAQIEVLKLLGQKSINTPEYFFTSQPIRYLNMDLTILDYVVKCQNTTRDFLIQERFPKNFPMLVTVSGMVVNDFGRKSILKMFAKDFEGNKDKFRNHEIEISFLGEYFQQFSTLLCGYLNREQINSFGNIYFQFIKKMNQKYFSSL